ncbi:hypothetical protein QVD17_35573 [Tagetes erecta]|uniref:DUF936 family protein n=1 Tax=Tagetes erecta TaxID=13708 RepID=A0AAD8NF85_TARER|nr:hypothetical protein QVD17_35573 [Tagetes erecta]
MAKLKLTPGVLLKLLDAMNSGVKPVSEHRSSLLQVADIMPIDVDEKNLWPKQGFYVKVTDSSHSIYVILPSDLIFRNEIQLGQFVFVERLECGSPVPVAKGVKPLPGRQPFVEMPEPLMNLDHVLNLSSKLCTYKMGSWVTAQKNEQDVCAVNLNSNTNLSRARRNSWVPGLKRENVISESLSHMSLKPTHFDHSAPMKKRSSVMMNEISARKIVSNRRSSLSRLTEGSVIVNKSCVAKTVTSSYNSAENKSVTPPSSQVTRTVSSPHSSSKTSLSFNLPQKLSLLGKEAVQQHERAQKIALQALRNASATDTLVWSLKTLSTLTKSANPDDPTDYIDQFLEFHNQIVQAITNMVSIKAATETTNKELKHTQILHDLMNNNTSKRKSLSHPSQQKSTVTGKQLRSSSSLNDTIKLGKQIEKEAGNWFIEFLEKCLEKGMKKSKSDGKSVPQLLVKKVMNWVEIEQFDSSKRPLHPKAVDIARQLRIKLRNS